MKILVDPLIWLYKLRMDILRYVPAIGAAVGLTTLVLAYWNYRRQINLEKLKWLQQLYEKFYNDDLYKPIRQRIDYDRLDDLLPLLRTNEADFRQLTSEQCDQLDEFTDYLNFFEWIAFSEKKGQLQFEDIEVMFDYYLNRIVRIDNNHDQQISMFMRKNGYEQLVRLLEDHYSLRRGQ